MLIAGFCDIGTTVPPPPPLRRPKQHATAQDIAHERAVLFPAAAAESLGRLSLAMHCVMLNNLLYLADELDQLEAHISERWRRLVAASFVRDGAAGAMPADAEGTPLLAQGLRACERGAVKLRGELKGRYI